MKDRCSHCNCIVCKCDRNPPKDSVRALKAENDRLRSALTEIRDIGLISDGPGAAFYASVADRALEEQ